MPGSRGRDFRGGDLAEGLGLELLRPFAFIAPVPRTEDIGIDAVATLFHTDRKRLIAKESFLVQVKASSVRRIQYTSEQLEWLRALRLPFFWLSVDLATSTVELWSMIRATGHPNFRERKSVTVYLDKRSLDLSGDEMHVSLKTPILRWKPEDATSKDFQQVAYEVIKGWVEFEMRCLAVRPLGMTLPIIWETNCIPQPTGSYVFMHDPVQLPSLLEDIRPYIEVLSSLSMGALFGAEQESSAKLLSGMILISDYMRHHGVDPDPRHALATVFKHIQWQQQTQSTPVPSHQTLDITRTANE